MSTSSSKAKTFTALWRASISLFHSGPSYVYERVCRAVNTETFRDVEAQALGLRGRGERANSWFQTLLLGPAGLLRTPGTRGSPPPEPGARHPGSSRSPARPLGAHHAYALASSGHTEASPAPPLRLGRPGSLS